MDLVEATGPKYLYISAGDLMSVVDSSSMGLVSCKIKLAYSEQVFQPGKQSWQQFLFTR
jgi:hypothetical protein